MKHVFVPYTVKPEALKKVKTIIAKFISEIKKNEPGTLYYKSLQNAEDSLSFVHVMTFLDDEAEHLHKKSAYCREFTDVLYPLCDIMPTPSVYHEIV